MHDEQSVLDDICAARAGTSDAPSNMLCIRSASLSALTGGALFIEFGIMPSPATPEEGVSVDCLAATHDVDRCAGVGVTTFA